MDGLEDEPESLSDDHEKDRVYTLNLDEDENSIVSNHDELNSLSDTVELIEGSSKELPRLIIQEQLEENAPARSDPDVNADYQIDAKVESDIHLQAVECKGIDMGEIGSGIENNQLGEADNDNPKLTGKPVPILPADVTPFLVLAYNAEKGVYEGNVLFGKSNNRNNVVVKSDLSGNESDGKGATNVGGGTGGDDDEANAGEKSLQTVEHLYLCDQCDKVCHTLETIREHQAAEHPNITSCSQISRTVDRNLTCPYRDCGRKFAWPTHLRYHILTHTGKRMFTCEVEGCDASFYTVQRLTVHSRIHTGEKPFLCTEKNCKKAFTTQGNLKNHMRVHSGDRPFGCDVPGCGKRFAEHSSLRKHSLVHTGKKPYECEICGKRFSQSGSKNVHLNRHKMSAANTALSRTLAQTQGNNGETMFLVYQQQGLSPQDVVLSNVVTDNVVTITSQQADAGLDGINQENILKIDEHGPGEGASPLSAPSSSANVVVLSQPEELVAMTPGYHAHPSHVNEELVYSDHDLLNVDMT